MGQKKQSRFQPDPRTWLLLCLLGIAAILVIRSEIGCLCLFLTCLLIHLLAGNGGKNPSLWAVLPHFYGIGWLGVRLMDTGVAFSVSSMLSSIGIVSRKVLVPLSFAICLAGEPTAPMAALRKLRLPKSTGIGTAVVLRFFPTIAGEYRAIRSSQRFRGIGVGVLHTPCPSTHHDGVYSDSAYPSHDEGGGGTLRLYDGAGACGFLVRRSATVPFGFVGRTPRFSPYCSPSSVPS